MEWAVQGYPFHLAGRAHLDRELNLHWKKRKSKENKEKEIKHHKQEKRGKKKK